MTICAALGCFERLRQRVFRIKDPPQIICVLAAFNVGLADQRPAFVSAFASEAQRLCRHHFACGSQLYLPEPHNDFIFATWCEEMGLIGALLVILLFAYLIYRGFRVARYAPDKFGSLLATGITAKLAIQTLMNLFVVTGIMPVTGAALPFFSYGGTALLLQLGEMGILLNISRYMRIDGRNQD